MAETNVKVNDRQLSSECEGGRHGGRRRQASSTVTFFRHQDDQNKDVASPKWRHCRDKKRQPFLIFSEVHVAPASIPLVSGSARTNQFPSAADRHRDHRRREQRPASSRVKST